MAAPTASEVKRVVYPHPSIHAEMPMGGNVVAGGATFRVWAPRAREVHVIFNGSAEGTRQPETRLTHWDDGTWVGFVGGVGHGAIYQFFVVGPEPDANGGFKRDPYARDLTDQPAWPNCRSILYDPACFPWHDQGFRPPAFNELILYQLHIGTWRHRAERATGTFIDVIEQLDYLESLGVNAVQFLPVVEFAGIFSEGYNGVDYFSPETDYTTLDGSELNLEALRRRLAGINQQLRARGHERLYAMEDILGTANQFRMMIDMCHVYGIAVILDVVYNHAGGGWNRGDGSLYFFDRVQSEDNRDSLYFSDNGWAGGLVFDYAKDHVRQFLIDNACYTLTECHADGLRYDEVSVIKNVGEGPGWRFCRDVTDTCRFFKPQAIQIAESWPTDDVMVRPTGEGGAGFDATLNDGLREAIREAIGQAAMGADAFVDFGRLAAQLPNPALHEAWRAVNCIENHDLVYQGRRGRIAKIADPENTRSWYATSRARVALGLLLTAPGIPHLFMGQEILEDKPWSDDPQSADQIYWPGLEDAGAPGHRQMDEYFRFTRELIAVRRTLPALRGAGMRVFHWDNANRVIAFQRWVPGEGGDVIVVASLKETTWHDYRIGFPGAGRWREVFNSDVYENWVNPQVAGNGGGVEARGPGMHGFEYSAALTIPANGLVVFAR